MEDKNILWTCTVCNRVPSNQSLRTCPRCGRKLMAWDRSKDPLERQPEWPRKEDKEKDIAQSSNRIVYSEFYEKSKQKKE